MSTFFEETSCGHNKQFIFVGGNPVFAACAYIAYDGKKFIPNSEGLYGKTYTPLDWCKVSGDTQRGEWGQVITITITKPCKVSVYSTRPTNNSTGNSKVEMMENARVEANKSFTIRGNDYNLGIGIVVIKEN